MQRARRLVGLAGLLATGFAPTPAFADKPGEQPAQDGDVSPATEAPKEAVPPAPILPAAPAVTPAAAAVAPPPRPKFGDVSISGYFRGSFGATQKQEMPGQAGAPDNVVGGRMTCFQLALPGNLHAKYRLGNECEVWSETHFTVVTFAGDDGTVASLHFMPTVYIPTTNIGYPPTGVVNSPLQYTTSTGATLSFPNLYADIKGIEWLYGGTAWAGTRYYKRESIYINDFFYWNPSGVGAGIEDAFRLGNLWRSAPDWLKDVAFSEAVFAVDGEPGMPGGAGSPPLPAQTDFGLRNDLQIRGLRPWWGAELQFGFQYLADLSNDLDANGNPVTHGGWGATVQWVQKLGGFDNKLAGQYGRGGGTGFGTLARFYYPDFSLRHDPNEFRVRVVDVLAIQPVAWFGQQVSAVYQYDDLNTGTAGQATWTSLGSRVSFGIVRHLKLLGEAGYDHVKKNNGADAQWLAKFTGAVSLTADRGFWTRPEINLFYTWAMWDMAAQTATIDDGMVYTALGFLSGATYGIQAETWW